MISTTTYKKNGFSLIELSIVLLIVSLLAAGMFSIFSSRVDIANYTNTKDRVTAIIAALNRFYAANNRLPCPAQGTLKVGDANYGLPIYSNGSGLDTGCDTNILSNVTAIADNHAANTPAGTLSVDAGGGHWVRQGTIPSRVLGLSDALMYDGYGNKFTYAVTEKFTTNAVDGAITVNDGVAPAIITPSAAFVVISHGKDGKGAYTSTGNIGLGCNALDGKDKENCNGDAIFTETQFNDLSRDSATWYDDVIGWEDKNTVIGLMASGSTALSIKFTTATHNADFGGSAGANVLCAAEYAGYAFCNKATDLAAYGAIGELPNTTTYFGNSGWVDGGSNTCSSWSSVSGNGDLLTIAGGVWSISGAPATCNSLQSIACCHHY